MRWIECGRTWNKSRLPESRSRAVLYMYRPLAMARPPAPHHVRFIGGGIPFSPSQASLSLERHLDAK